MKPSNYKKPVVEHMKSPIRMEVAAPEIAAKARPGQFVMVMADKRGERIPLTIVDADAAGGTITLIFQESGFTTRLLSMKRKPYAIVGPLGHPAGIKKYGRVILVGGGIGAAEIYPVARALREAGNQIISILGAKRENLLALENELREISDEQFVVTDDGSSGEKGIVTDALKKLVSHKEIDLVYAVGPLAMMQAVSLLTKEFGIKTVVSLNALMVDGTGMCGCCRVSVGGEVKFACVDGPDFDGHLVDWDEIISRNNIYKDKEEHICKMGRRPGG